MFSRVEPSLQPPGYGFKSGLEGRKTPGRVLLPMIKLELDSGCLMEVIEEFKSNMGDTMDDWWVVIDWGSDRENGEFKIPYFLPTENVRIFFPRPTGFYRK